MSVGQLSQLATDSNLLSSLWETVMSHLRHSTPAFTDPSHIASSINHPTVFHIHMGGGLGNLDPGPKIDEAEPSFASTDETLRSYRP